MEARAQALVEAMPFAAGLDIELLSATAEEVVGRMAWAEPRLTTGGLVHGGALMAFADSLGAICAFLNLPPEGVTTTIESKTNFFRALREGHATGTSTPLHVGRTTIVVQTDIRNDEGKRLALVTQTQAVLRT